MPGARWRRRTDCAKTARMDLAAYFARIGYDGPVRPDAATLIGLHRAHRSAVPYENLDVQLGIPLTVDPGRLGQDRYAPPGRLVFRAELRGCFFGAEAIGWRTMRRRRRAAGRRGRYPQRHHPGILLVDLGEPWVADVGFGAGGPFDLDAAARRPVRRRGFANCGWSGSWTAGGAITRWPARAPTVSTSIPNSAIPPPWWPVPSSTAPESPFVNNAMVNLAEVDRVLAGRPHAHHHRCAASHFDHRRRGRVSAATRRDSGWNWRKPATSGPGSSGEHEPAVIFLIKCDLRCIRKRR